MVREEYAEPESFGRLLSSIECGWIEEALEATGTATIASGGCRRKQWCGWCWGWRCTATEHQPVVNHLHLACRARRPRSGAEPQSIRARARLATSRCAGFFERCAQSWAHASADRHRHRGFASYGVDGSTVRTLIRQRIAAHFGGQSAATAERVATRRAGGHADALRSHLLAAARSAPPSARRPWLKSCGRASRRLALPS